MGVAIITCKAYTALALGDYVPAHVYQKKYYHSRNHLQAVISFWLIYMQPRALFFKIDYLKHSHILILTWLVLRVGRSDNHLLKAGILIRLIQLSRLCNIIWLSALLCEKSG